MVLVILLWFTFLLCVDTKCKSIGGTNILKVDMKNYVLKYRYTKFTNQMMKLKLQTSAL